MLKFMEYLSILEGSPDSWLTPAKEPLEYLYKKYKSPTSWGNINTADLPPVFKTNTVKIQEKEKKNRKSK